MKLEARHQPVKDRPVFPYTSGEAAYSKTKISDIGRPAASRSIGMPPYLIR